MNEETIFYVISNAGTKEYPDNKLTSFVNRFPIPLEIDNRYEIGVQSIGFSSLFKNVSLPENEHAPSIIITNCKRTNDERFTLCRRDDQYLGSYDYICPGPIKFDFSQINNPFCVGCPCFTWQKRLEDREYSYSDISNLMKEISDNTGLNAKVIGDGKTFKISIEMGPKYQDTWGFHICYVMFHQTAKDSLAISPITLATYWRRFSPEQKIEKLGQISEVSMQGRQMIERYAGYKGEKYFAYELDHVPLDDGKFVESFVMGEIILFKPKYPKYIKVVCDNVEEQILNSEYSKDVLVYSPDFSNISSYTFQEIETVEYMPLLNHYLTELKIKLLDENNNRLQLQTGHATIIKFAIRRMPEVKKSFHVTLTSESNELFQTNKITSFKAKLPTPLNLDNKWKVSINSVSHPTKFSTFLGDVGRNSGNDKQRSFIFKPNNFIPVNPITSKQFNLDRAYSDIEICDEIDSYLKFHKIGTCKIEYKNFIMQIQQPGKFILGYDLAMILGYGEHIGGIGLSGGQKLVSLSFGADTDSTKKSWENRIIFKFPYTMNIGYNDPKYIMVYSNIVQPKLVGGEYRKLLRITPIEDNDLNYITHYFKHKEFCELENSLIDTVEITLATHDGRQVNFASDQDVIVNLEFSNYLQY